MPSAEFEKAYTDAREKIGSGPSNEQQLNLYAWAKIAKGDEPKKPGMFDMKGKATYGAWQKASESGMSAKEAEKKYIDLSKELIQKYPK